MAHEEAIIVTDAGFRSEDWTGGFVEPERLAANGQPGAAVDLNPDSSPEDLRTHLDQLGLIRIAFPAFSDGRGFTLARILRRMGYRGRLRAAGHVLADQYAMARRAGFDEVEISPDLAARQPWDHWQARADWRDNDYQSRLRGAAFS